MTSKDNKVGVLGEAGEGHDHSGRTHSDNSKVDDERLDLLIRTVQGKVDVHS